jgi:hypothetical protein
MSEGIGRGQKPIQARNKGFWRKTPLPPADGGDGNAIAAERKVKIDMLQITGFGDCQQTCRGQLFFRATTVRQWFDQTARLKRVAVSNGTHLLDRGSPSARKFRSFPYRVRPVLRFAAMLLEKSVYPALDPERDTNAMHGPAFFYIRMEGATEKV